MTSDGHRRPNLRANIVRGMIEISTPSLLSRGQIHLALVKVAGTRWRFPFPSRKLESETSRAVADVQKRAKLPGFRPGKAPASLDSQAVRQRYPAEGAGKPDPQLPAEADRSGEPQRGRTARHHRRAFPRWRAADASRPNSKWFPEIELEEYKDVEVPYHDPEVTDEDVDKRLDELREAEGASIVNVDPRPVGSGDYAVVALESVGGVEGEPIKQDEMVLEIGGARHLRGVHREPAAASPRATRRSSKSPIRRITAPPGWPARR